MEDSSPLLEGQVALVTGASRGIGKGIALQLGEAGATVYITGRTLESKSGVTGSLRETASEVEARGGRCIPVKCDHTNDDDIKAVFDRITREQNGRLDLLVNNAFSAINTCVDVMDQNFWDLEPELWDHMNNVGLRNHYICCVYAARMMTPRRRGLILNMSSSGALTYMFTVTYGVGKVAFDRLAVDCAHELRSHNVAAVSLWPGPIRTENLTDTLETDRSETSKWVLNIVKEQGATPEFVGHCVVRLAADPAIMKKSGRVLMAPDLASEYGFADVDGTVPANMRSLRQWLARGKWSMFSYLVPDFIRLPGWVISMSCSRL